VRVGGRGERVEAEEEGGGDGGVGEGAGADGGGEEARWTVLMWLFG
jgi:hypothetical protein